MFKISLLSISFWEKRNDLACESNHCIVKQEHRMRYLNPNLYQIRWRNADNDPPPPLLS